MKTQQLKTALNEFKSFENICKETANAINEVYKEMTNKMWEIGKIIFEKRKKVNPQYGDKFLQGIVNEMESEISVSQLGMCENFFSKFPDLQTRVCKTQLTPSHYQSLDHIKNDKFLSTNATIRNEDAYKMIYQYIQKRFER